MAVLKRIHPVAGFVGFATILLFWTSTVASEVSRSEPGIVWVKAAIPWGFILLIPALALTGLSGFRIAGASAAPLIRAKRGRMPFIAANGLLILVPCAFFLRARALEGTFDALFYAVQGIELLAGATNLALMGLSIRDGLRLKGRLKRSR